MKFIRTLLADDHTVVREGLRALLHSDGGIQVVGEARNGREAVELTMALRPDVVVMDIAMPLLNGLEATRKILAAAPVTKVLILSAHSDDAYIDRVIAIGAAGFLIKQTSAQILDHAIHEVMAGNKFYSPVVLKRVRDRYQKASEGGVQVIKRGTSLTSRELEVVQLVAEGQANKQVAAGLNISIKTVEKHRQHLMDKLGIHDTAGLTRYAIARGIIESSAQAAIDGLAEPQAHPPGDRRAQGGRTQS
jgi:DNA-binding NarL/FixJ family response regulator